MTRDGDSLREIRAELRDNRMYLDDEDLRRRVGEWIEESSIQTDADTAEQFVEEQLNEMLEEYDMYHSDTARGEDEFPDECEGCAHYGSACPVLRDRTERRWRDRKLEQAETEQEARAVYRQQARDVSCHRIPEFLGAWDSRFSDLLERGQRLRNEVEDHLHDKKDGGDELPDEGLGADGEHALADGGGDA